MLLIAAPVLHAPDDPGQRGLWGIVALLLLVGLIAAHVRVLRAVARQLETADPDQHPEPAAPPRPQAGDAEPARPPR